MKILIAEDDPVSRRILEATLRQRGAMKSQSLSMAGRRGMSCNNSPTPDESKEAGSSYQLNELDEIVSVSKV